MKSSNNVKGILLKFYALNICLFTFFFNVSQIGNTMQNNCNLQIKVKDLN